jgi:hypothetical protein
MKTLLILFLTVGFMSTSRAHAQGLQSLATNTVMGTANGTLLGLGTMALLDDADWAPIRIGVGMGTLYGLGVGIYDVSVYEVGSGHRVQGMFNSANYTSMIVLLDTFYGGVTGGVVGTAMALMVNKPLVKGLQYGTGAGVWAGFTFGLVDAFYFSSSKAGSLYSSLEVTAGESTTIGFLRPNLYTTPLVSNGRMAITQEIGLDVARVTIRL